MPPSRIAHARQRFLEKNDQSHSDTETSTHTLTSHQCSISSPDRSATSLPPNSCQQKPQPPFPFLPQTHSSHFCIFLNQLLSKFSLRIWLGSRSKSPSSLGKAPLSSSILVLALFHKPSCDKKKPSTFKFIPQPLALFPNNSFHFPSFCVAVC